MDIRDYDSRAMFRARFLGYITMLMYVIEGTKQKSFGRNFESVLPRSSFLPNALSRP